MASYSSNDLVSWCIQNNVWIRGPKDERQATHFFMYPPGKACIPCEDTKLYKEFLVQYASFVNTHEDYAIGVVEAHGSTLFLHIDVDFKSLEDPDAVLAPAKLDILLQVVFSVVQSVLPEASEMVVCTASPYKLANGLYKAGLHLHWPGVTVDMGKAPSCRNACIAACSKSIGICPMGSWEDVFDRSIFYPEKGLRMIGSVKGAGQQSIYLPTQVVRAYGTEIVPNAHKGFFQWVFRTRVACPAREHANDPDAVGEEHFQHLSLGQTCRNIGVEQEHTLLEAVREATSHEEFKFVPYSKLIVFFPPEAAAPKKSAKRLAKRAQAKQLPWLVIPLKSKRCLNLMNRTCHTSNHTYLMVDRTGVWQRCFNTTQGVEAQRKHDCCCNKFQIQVGYMTATLKKLLSQLQPPGTMEV